jgi:putative inorganic carbon (HCO3(-)) transporter
MSALREVEAGATAADGAVPGRTRHILVGTAATAVVAAALLTAVTAVVAGSGPQAPAWLMLAPLLLGVGALFAVLAALRFEALVLLLLTARASLDAFDTGQSMGVATLVALGFLAAASLWLGRELALRRNVGGTPLGWHGAALLGAAALSTLLSVAPLISAVESARLASVVVMLVVLERLARRPGAVPRLYLAAYLSLPVPLAVAAVQLARGGVPGLVDDGGGFPRLTGTLVHPNSLAMYVTFLLVPGVALWPRVSRTWRIPFAALLLLAAGLLLTTYTRAAWLGAAAGVLLVAWLMRRKLAVVALVAITALAMTPPVTERFADVVAQEPQALSSASGAASTNSLAWRFRHWSETVRLVEERPWTGLGPRIVEESSDGNKSTHNDYLRAYAELGAIGLVAYLSLLARFVVIAVQALRRSRTPWERSVAAGFAGTLTAFLLMSLTDNLMSQSVVMWYLAVPAAAASAVAARSVLPVSRERERVDIQ